jgi:hypothetical protein
VQFAEGMYAARKARKTMTSFRTLLDTTAPDATILVGAVFLSEGIQKFLFSVTSYGFWSTAHEARADFCMFLGSAFLLIVGGGGWSLDRVLARK